MELKITNLHARIEGKEILKGINLTIRTGEMHAIMGPNGSGKSTLSNVIMGHPSYQVTEGSITLDGQDVLAMPTHERALNGLFMAFQYPVEIPGITVGRFLKRAVEVKQEFADAKAGITPAVGADGKKAPPKASGFVKTLRENMSFMEMDQQFINRYLNEGFSGGEKKRMEVLQMLMLKPRFAILDETDSGLDIDALKIVSKGVNKLVGPDFGAIVITHYQRLLNHIVPDTVHILYKGRIVQSGGKELVHTLEEQGYDWVRQQYGSPDDAPVTDDSVMAPAGGK
jgi:Fe-S cluster assembly ATP-binding protein